MTAFIRALVAACAAALTFGTAAAGAAPTTYIPMPDGIKLAANLVLPSGTAPAGGWPTAFTYDGYDGGTSSSTGPNGFAKLHVSIRGTGCSGGQFDLFDLQHARDGVNVIRWIKQQDWSNDRVGLIGHSYGGITATLTAAQAGAEAEQLDALVASGLIDDLYRGIVYPGGVPNLGFPLIWPYAYRPAVDVGTGTALGLTDGGACAQNLADREANNVSDEPLTNGLVGYNDGPWWQAHSIYTRIHSIKAPTFVGHAWQDEQTGPRGGPTVWQKLPAGLPKRLVISNGDHSVNGGRPPEVRAQRMAWLERFVADVNNGIDAKPRVQILLETHEGTGGAVSNGLLEGNDFPLAGTDWKRWYLREGHGLSTTAPGPHGGSHSYVSGTGRQAWVFFTPTLGGELSSASGPDEQAFRSAPMASPTTIAGPIAARLFARTTAVGVRTPIHSVDTDFFVTVIDQAPDGRLTYLQRGMLRASFRALDEANSPRNADGEIIRPEHPFTHPEQVLPAEIRQYDIEIFPVAHVFRPGHRILVKIYSPPLADSLYAYIPTRQPGLTTIVHDAAHPSSLLLPMVATPALGSAQGCGALIGMRCNKPVR